MKRKQVTLYLNGNKEPFVVEAYCSKCVCWERKEPYEIEPPSHMSCDPEIVECDRGDCHRYPDKINKHQDDWCREFQPDQA